MLYKRNKIPSNYEMVLTCSRFAGSTMNIMLLVPGPDVFFSSPSIRSTARTTADREKTSVCVDVKK